MFAINRKSRRSSLFIFIVSNESVTQFMILITIYLSLVHRPDVDSYPRQLITQVTVPISPSINLPHHYYLFILVYDLYGIQGVALELLPFLRLTRSLALLLHVA